MIIPLSRPYPGRSGLPVVERVDARIYLEAYFAACMDCTFCHDWCCLEGAGVEAPVVEHILAHADALEAAVGIPRGRWFEDGFEADADYPGGRYTSTRVVEGACVFLNRRGRGCLLHRFALENGLDVHTIKPLACAAYPLWCDEGLLRPQRPVREGKLVCTGTGPTLYRGTREVLEHHFGADLVAELDALEAGVHAGASQEDAARTISLPVLAEPPRASAIPAPFSGPSAAVVDEGLDVRQFKIGLDVTPFTPPLDRHGTGRADRHALGKETAPAPSRPGAQPPGQPLAPG